MSTKERLKKFIKHEGLTISSFEKRINVSNGYVNNISKGVGEDILKNILENFSNLNTEWLLTGKGEMLKSETPQEPPKKKPSIEELKKIAKGEGLKKRNLIPLYNDVSSIGGTQLQADLQPVSSTTEYIDAGDWFPDATAAIRHYGESMAEYPNGCILAIRLITNHKHIVWGQNYVIETDEYRVTKRLQTHEKNDNMVMAYSTNTDTYADGRLVHEPFAIDKEDIRRLFLVVGYVTKAFSSAPVFIKG